MIRIYIIHIVIRLNILAKNNVINYKISEWKAIIKTSILYLKSKLITFMTIIKSSFSFIQNYMENLFILELNYSRKNKNIHTSNKSTYI